MKGMQIKGVVIRLLTFTKKEIAGVCEACQFGKQHRQPFPKESNISKRILDIIHSDVWGLAETETFGGCQYYITFIEDFSMHTWIFLIRQKGEVFKHFQTFKSELEKATDKHVRCLQSNGGKEYFSDAFTTYIRQKGIQREFTYQHTPQHN